MCSFCPFRVVTWMCAHSQPVIQQYWFCIRGLLLLFSSVPAFVRAKHFRLNKMARNSLFDDPKTIYTSKTKPKTHRRWYCFCVSTPPHAIDHRMTRDDCEKKNFSKVVLMLKSKQKKKQFHFGMDSIAGDVGCKMKINLKYIYYDDFYVFGTSNESHAPHSSWFNHPVDI